MEGKRREVEGMEVALLFLRITMQHGIESHVVEGPTQIIQLKHEDIGCGDIIINIDKRNFSRQYTLPIPCALAQIRLPLSCKGQQAVTLPIPSQWL